MDQFIEILDTISLILQRNNRPLLLDFLTIEVNKAIPDRPLSTITVRLLLQRTTERFIETKKDEWSLREWVPDSQGINVLRSTGPDNPWGTATGRMESFEPSDKDFRAIISDLLDNLVPGSEDRQVLDKLTTFHLLQSSYKSNSLPQDTVDANCLVPPMVYEVTKNLSWRYPPMMESTFFIRPEPGQTPQISIQGLIGIASFLEYQEKRDFGERQISQRRFVNKPEIYAPKEFAAIKLNGMNYFLHENTETKDFCRKSAEPIFFKFEIAQSVSENSSTEYEFPEVQSKESIVQSYDEEDQKFSKVQQINPFRPVGLTLPLDKKSKRYALVIYRSGEVRAKLTIESKHRTDWGVIEVTVRLSNDFQSSRQRVDDEFILRHCLIFPHLYISLTNAICLVGAQQHLESLEEVRSQSTLTDQERFISELSTQTNCIFTRSTTRENCFVLTTFGVYDTIRLDPVSGPNFEVICNDIQSFIKESSLSEAAIKYLRDNSYRSACVLAVLRAIQRSFRGSSGPLDSLYKYQWKAIQNRIEILASKSISKATVIRAPTGAGKTLVFFANAAIHYLFTGQRAVMTFPTRILNEDMFKRLTRFIYALREEFESIDARLVNRINGGILIGTSDPSYSAIVNPVVNQMMVQYDGCPRCQEKGERSKVICQQINGKLCGVCENQKCQHVIDYMIGPNQVADFLPALTIATPDKLFYEATIRPPQKALRFFGGPCIRCTCGFHISLMNKDGQINDAVTCSQCKQIIEKVSANSAGPGTLPRLVKSPPLYFVLDEIHSLYGVTATLISYFFSLLKEMARSFNADFEPTFETGTATIANERELIEAITHRKMLLFPMDDEYFDYFVPKPNRVRYRALMFMPVGKAYRSTITNAISNYVRANQSSENLLTSLHTLTPGDYEFLLAYIPRKSNGYAIANELRRLLDDKNITFLSGDTPTARLVTLLQEIFDGDINLLLANMVVSLGIDIPRLNNMLMLGIPKSMTEMVQTVGRTGRGTNSGHVVVHLQPSIPRDEFVFGNFHRVMGDVTGYFDRKPVTAVNAYVANLIFINVVHALLSTRLSENYLNTFCNRSGDWLAQGNNARTFLGRIIKEILGRDGSPDLQREIAIDLQPQLRDIIFELSVKQAHLFQWIGSRPDALYSLRARSDKVPVVISQVALLGAMQAGIAQNLRPIDHDDH